MPTYNGITVNIVPNEIIFPGGSIVVESKIPLDPKSAQSSIVVRGIKGRVELSRDARIAKWSAENVLQPGHHKLYIGGLLTDKGEIIEGEVQIPFYVTDSLAKIPKTVCVESMTRLRIQKLGVNRLAADRRPQGSYLEIMKASSRDTGAPVEMAFDETGRTVKPQPIFQKILENRVRKFGKLHETLYLRLQEVKEDTRIHVALWLRSDETPESGDKKTKERTSEPAAHVTARQEKINAVARNFVLSLTEQYGKRRFQTDLLAPVVYAKLTRKEITALSRNPEVVGLFLYEPTGLEDLDSSIAISNSDHVHTLGYKGSGVNVGVWEDAPDDTTNLSIADSYMTSGFTTSQHARHTHGIIKNIQKDKPHGHAPSCSLYSANSPDLAALRWAAQDEGCTVISQSFHRSSEPGSALMSFDDIYKDWLALQWPYPTICQAAGNYWQGDADNVQPPSSEYVNHKGYNGLTVGNHDDDADEISGSSVFRNPSSTHGDRELPEIAANGTAVTTVGLTMSGTSMASPAAAGCVALIQSVDDTLKSWPEGCRAIMLAGAKRNIVGNTWWQDVVADVDASDGTGAVDALEAVQIASVRRQRNAAAVMRGWDVGTLLSTDIGDNRQTTFSYSVKLPTKSYSPRHVKVALAWDSKISKISIFGMDLLLGSTLTVDLDLQVYNSQGVQVGYSGSWDNSYEIAEFEGSPGETYTIKIRRWSGTDNVWYGIAWTVTGGLSWANATRFSTLQQLLLARQT